MSFVFNIRFLIVDPAHLCNPASYLVVLNQKPVDTDVVADKPSSALSS